MLPFCRLHLIETDFHCQRFCCCCCCCEYIKNSLFLLYYKSAKKTLYLRKKIDLIFIAFQWNVSPEPKPTYDKHNNNQQNIKDLIFWYRFFGWLLVFVFLHLSTFHYFNILLPLRLRYNQFWLSTFIHVHEECAVIWRRRKTIRIQYLNWNEFDPIESNRLESIGINWKIELNHHENKSKRWRSNQFHNWESNTIMFCRNNWANVVQRNEIWKCKRIWCLVRASKSSTSTGTGGTKLKTKHYTQRRWRRWREND